MPSVAALHGTDAGDGEAWGAGSQREAFPRRHLGAVGENVVSASVRAGERHRLIGRAGASTAGLEGLPRWDVAKRDVELIGVAGRPGERHREVAVAGGYELVQP